MHVPIWLLYLGIGLPRGTMEVHACGILEHLNFCSLRQWAFHLLLEQSLSLLQQSQPDGAALRERFPSHHVAR